MPQAADRPGGNCTGRGSDSLDVEQFEASACAHMREVLSAVMDGEADAAETALVQQHLQECPACRRWRIRAEALTRRVRLSPTAPNGMRPVRVGEQFRPRLLHVLQGPAGSRLRLCARIALGVVTAAQALISGLCLAGLDPMGTRSMSGSMRAAGMTHLDHESAAWNLAVVAGLLWVALRPRKGVGVLPLLSAFVAVLTGLCITDLIDGQVTAARVAMHIPVLAGLMLSIMVVGLHAGPVLPPGFTRRGTTGANVLPAAPLEDPAVPGTAADTPAQPPMARRAAG